MSPSRPWWMSRFGGIIAPRWRTKSASPCAGMQRNGHPTDRSRRPLGGVPFLLVAICSSGLFGANRAGAADVGSARAFTAADVLATPVVAQSRDGPTRSGAGWGIVIAAVIAQAITLAMLVAAQRDLRRLRRKSQESERGLHDVVECPEDRVSVKAAEQELRENERRLATLFRNLPGMAYRCRNDRNWTLEFVSEGCLDLTGYTSEALCDRREVSYADLIVPEDRDRVWDEVQKAIARGAPFQLEYRIRRRDGLVRWVWEKGCGVNDESGRLICLEGVVFDVTQRKDTTRALERRNAILRGVSQAQLKFITEADAAEIYGELLRTFVDVSESEYGFIGEVRYDPAGAPYLKTHAITPLDWAEATRHIYDEMLRGGLEFRNLDTLFGAVLTTRQPVMANDPASDPRSAGLPEGHPPLHAFLGVPLMIGDQLLGMVGLANRAGGYDDETLQLLQPLFATGATVIEAWRAEERRRAAEVSLRTSEQRFRAIAEQSQVGIWQLTSDYRTVYANGAMCRMLDVSDPSEFSRFGPLDFCPPERVPRVRSELAKRAQGIASTYETDLVTREGRRVTAIVCGAPIPNAQGAPTEMIASFTDITDRKRAEAELRRIRDELEDRVRARTADLERTNTRLGEALERERRTQAALRESEERFHQLADAASEGIIVHDRERVLDANQAAAEMFGYSADRMKQIDRIELIAPEYRAQTLQAPGWDLTRGAAAAFETVGCRRDGTRFPIEVRSKALPYQGRIVSVLVVRDISQQRLAEQQERRHQAELAHVLRRATLGELASGLAHEINQPLTAISNYSRGALRLIQRKGSSVDELRPALLEIAEQSARAGEIIRRIRDFVRREEPRRAPTDINKLVRNAAQLMKSDLAGAGATLQLRLAHNLPSLSVDAVQIEQVILNLLRNSCDAVRERPADHRRIVVASQWVTDESVEVCVKDSGPGISAEARRNLFSPFFTTKPQGMGLGLSISRSLAEAHGGELQLVDVPDGVGAVFQLRIPVPIG